VRHGKAVLLRRRVSSLFAAALWVRKGRRARLIGSVEIRDVALGQPLQKDSGMHNTILATKVGMTQVYAEDGSISPVTVLEVGPCTVDLVRTTENDKYDAVKMSLNRGGKIVASRESRIEPGESYESGQPLDAPFIEVGGKVDVIGTSKGRGFAGVMKRHNFHGQRASHGVKKVHRHAGSTGMSADPARVIKGTRMSGHYGNSQVTVRNLKVVQFDADSGVLAVKGAVPGPNGGLIVVRSPVEP
jgi:large subunit ribosomal protein L3